MSEMLYEFRYIYFLRLDSGQKNCIVIIFTSHVLCHNYQEAFNVIKKQKKVCTSSKFSLDLYHI